MLLKDIAYQKIKEKILDEAYQPGHFLSERALINDLDMSKTPIKNALARLETEGFVNVSSKQGIIVNDLSVERINDIYNLRIALEIFNCKSVYQTITGEQLKELSDNLDETKYATDKLDVKAFATLDHQFHLIISEIAGNTEITRTLLNYQDHLRRITLRHLNKDPLRVRTFYQEHTAIFKALENHHSDSIDLMQAHLQNSKSIYFNN